MNLDLLTKTFTFPEAKQVLAKQIKDFATQKEGSSAKSSVKRFELRIEKMEADINELQELTAQPSFYQQPQDKVTATLAQLQKCQADLEKAYQRWSELDGV